METYRLNEKCLYFKKEHVNGPYYICKICKKIPTECYIDSYTFSGIHRCSNCINKTFIPQSLREKFWYKIDKFLNFIKN